MTDDDRKVRDLLDPQTRADLERWFSLPSFEQLAEEGTPAEPVEDPAIAAVRERREQAIAAVDPALFAAHVARIRACEDMTLFASTVTLHVDPELGMIDRARVEQLAAAIAEPREVDLPPELLDDLNECTPQAILRDLHRSEQEFEKTFELVDIAAEQRLDIVAEVRSAMATRPGIELPEPGQSPWREGSTLLTELRAERCQPWPKLLAGLPLPNRRVEEKL